MRRAALALAFLGFPLAALADDPPVVDHQPVPCTIPGKAITLCAAVSDDNQVAKSRLYFKRAGEDYYSYVEMAFTGLNYCGTLPAPIEGKVETVEYYVQAVDDQYQPQRTSTYQMSVQPEGVCEFPPKEAARGASIKVYATNKKQGKKLDDAFSSVGVSFVPVAAK